jgi:hypothetical protein
LALRIIAESVQLFHGVLFLFVALPACYKAGLRLSDASAARTAAAKA